jgi:GxxExxY protein
MTHHRGTEDAEGPSIRRCSDILGAAIEVHRRLGPGLLESTYEACLCRELVLRQIPVERQIPLPLDYRGMKLNCGYRLDVIAYGAILIEVKAVTRVLPIHRAQVLTYLKLTGIRLGLLINFNVEVSDRASTVSSMNDETSVSSVPLW